MPYVISFASYIAPKLLTLLAIAAAAFVVSFVIKEGFSRLSAKMPEGSGRIVSKALTVVVVALAGFAALGVLGVNVGSLATIIGAVSVALGFALQNLLGNLANGVIMLWTKPFSVGQNIKVGDKSGTVKTIDLLYTKLSDEENEIVVPNGVLSSSVVVIHEKSSL